jgi:hypothetical protein
MTQECLSDIILECRKIANFLPTVASKISPDVSDEINTRLHNIECMAKHMHDGEMQAIRYLQNTHQEK